MKKLFGKLNQKFKTLVTDKSGALPFELIVGVIITVLIGGLLLTLFSDTIKDLWSSIVAKFTSTFNL